MYLFITIIIYFYIANPNWFSCLVNDHYFQRDWPSHKKYCKEKAKQRISYDVYPDR